MKKPVKVALKIVGVLLVALIILIVISYIPWIIVLCAYFFGENPEKPEIRYGEFDYSLVYEINGETKTINDTLVCEYDGISRSLEGKSVKWNSYIKGTNKEDCYLIFEDDEYKLYIYVPTDARYFMDEPDYDLYGFENPGEPWLAYAFVEPAEDKEYQFFSVDDYEEKFGVKIVSWEIEKPIENNYKK